MNKINFYIVNDDYVNYLNRIDNRVALNKDVHSRGFDRKYIGILLMIGDIKYVAPLSSYKEKHANMSEKLDFIKK